jgi:hypothetical protein
MSQRFLVISLHDFHPGSLERIEEQRLFLKELGIDRFSVLVVPEFHHGAATFESPEALNWMRARVDEGADLVLHGYYHDRVDRDGGSFFWTRLYTAGEAEFLDLPDEEALARLRRGRALWEARGWPLSGFIAPGWLMPREQDALLKELGFKWTVRLRSFKDLGGGNEIQAPSLCYSTRAAWRRAASRMWNPLLFSRLKQRALMRLSLHPDDLKGSAMRRQIRLLIEKALRQGRKPLRYADFIACAR